MNVVEAANLSKTFGSGHTAVTAVANISLNVGKGDIVLVMGPSGSGKTTLLSMIGTLLRPSSGNIKIDGINPADLSDKKLADLRLHKLGFMFQTFNLLSALSAKENVMIPLLTAGKSKKVAAQQAKELLESLHLGKRLNSPTQNLSGGEKQRVAAARALANNPSLILADEPTANLDSKTGFEVMQLLCQTACSEDRAVIIVSHDARLKEVAKRVITIEDGKLLKEEVGNHFANCPMH